MLEGVSLGRAALVEKFGVSNRLAVRIGALLAKGVQVTATVLEMAAPGAPFESVLLHADILARADELNEELLRATADELGAAIEPLAVVDRGVVRLIALQEEVLAEGGWPEPERTPSPTRPPDPAGAMPAIIGPEEAEHLFSPEEIARLKLEALTSADEGQRIAAIRRLQYAPINAREKGSIFLQVLLDPISPARAEAVKGLESLGFDHDTAEAIRDIFEEDERRRTAALHRLGALLARLDAAEKQIVLAILIGALRELSAVTAQVQILHILCEGAPVFAARPELCANVIGVCVHSLLSGSPDLEQPTWEFVMRVAELDPATLARQVRAQLSTLRDAHVRVFLFTMLVHIEHDTDSAESLAREMVRELVSGEAEELDQQKLGHNIVAIGEPAIRPLMDALRSGDNRSRTMLIGFMDPLMDTVPEAASFAPDLADLYLACLRSGDRRLRLEVIRSRVFTHPNVPPPKRRELAETLVQDMGFFTLPETLDRVDNLLEILGADAAQALYDLARDEPRSPEADRAIRILARIDRQRQLPERLRAAVLKLARRHADDRHTRGGFALALGVLASAPKAGVREGEEAARHLQAQVGKVQFHADVLNALGHLGAGPNLPLKQRLDIARLYSGLLDQTELHRDDLMREVETPDGRLYEFGPRAEFDAVALPVVIVCIRRMCLSEHVSDALRNRLAGRLVDIWDAVASWKAMWGPRSSEELAGALGAIGMWQATPVKLKIRIGRALQQFPERISAVRALGEIAGAAEPDDELNAMILDSGLIVLDRWSRETMTEDEREAVLAALARIAARPQLNPRSRRVQSFRREVVAQLFENLREERFWTRAPLERIRDAEGTSRALQKEIAARLADVFAIARQDPRKRTGP